MSNDAMTPLERQEKLKELMLRLHQGEKEEIIQEEFNKHFDSVSPYEIQVMERNLMQEGITYEEIMRLCKIHASLMSAKVEAGEGMPDFEKEGHPVMVLKKENLALRGAIDRIERLLQAYVSSKDEELLKGLKRQISLLDQFENHYLRKEYALFPIMESKGIIAPPKVMWGVHDEIREIYKNFKQAFHNQTDDVMEQFLVAKEELLEMIFKEENILIPMVAQAFHVDDWEKMAQDTPQYGYCIVTPEAEWKVEKKPSTIQSKEEIQETGDIPLSTGSLSLEQLDLLLNLLPMELSFVDKDNIVKYYNEGNGEEKIFKRTKSAIGRDVINCHPPKSHAIVTKLFEQLRSRQKEKEEMWFKKEDKMIHVTYHAVRNAQGEYMGVLEYVQNIAPYVKNFESKPLKRELS
ncbi:DUF438 domain-containing protein [uncultured Granulicatella sp.]|uniref:DUF438 domain-containing protein n=1 Tax=uncultured Granulicatella sp. TaxID=316089 RepID=UPI0028D8129C|nr:DUF438 domain-containing protein [uncultured Granulicatella sp.]